MARYTDSVCRMCRREGTKLFLKGEKCFSSKCAQQNRPTPPGQHGQARQRKASEYGLQLREKQKARRAYGLMEGQFKRTFARATGMKGITGDNLLQLLELRLQFLDFLFSLRNLSADLLIFGIHRKLLSLNRAVFQRQRSETASRKS